MRKFNLSLLLIQGLLNVASYESKVFASYCYESAAAAAVNDATSVKAVLRIRIEETGGNAFEPFHLGAI